MDFSFSEDQLNVQRGLREFCRKEIAPGAAELDEASPEDAVRIVRGRIRSLADSGFLGQGYPGGVGGSGGDLFGVVSLFGELGAVCPSTGLAALGSVGLCARALCEWGTGTSEQWFLSELLAGRGVGGYGAMEPGASLDSWDFRAGASSAGDGVSLNGRKIMVLNAPMRGPWVLPASEGGRNSLFLVAPDAEGVEVASAQRRMGLRGAPLADVTLTNSPAARLVPKAGEDPVAVLRSYEHLMLAALAEGMIRGALTVAGVYARDHEAGGKPMARHQEISFKLADAMLFQETARMLIYRGAWLLEQKDPEAAVLASSAKCFASESAVKAAGSALQIMGQDGYASGGPAERFWRDAKLLETLGDPSEKHRMFIADRVLGSC